MDELTKEKEVDTMKCELIYMYNQLKKEVDTPKQRAVSLVAFSIAIVIAYIYPPVFFIAWLMYIPWYLEAKKECKKLKKTHGGSSTNF